MRAADGLLVSRSDSTLRGHVMAEVAALQAARTETVGSGFDGVLLVPAFLEAGRLTAADIHWARVGRGPIPVGETEFARDPAFGYTASDLRDFVTEKSGGAIGRDDVAAISLADIRLGGPSRVRELLAGVRGGTWVVVNATEYSDLETAACGVLLAERASRSFLFRTGPSFVRALSGLGPRAPLRGEEIRPAGGRNGHGLARAVRAALAAKPAWVIAKGGITSHDVAVQGLGIRRAEVAGQLFPGLVSVFCPIDAAPEAVGVPYVVFAGNVGDDGTLGQAVAILNGGQEGS
jgi:uncharacterized protein YgbK (DUF1537 family)